MLKRIAAVALFVPLMGLNLFAQAQIEITDSHGKYRFEKPPERVVSLNWALSENLLELGVEPQGIADLDEFKVLSSVYDIPNSVVDVGPRLSPSLEKIKALKPEIILIGYSQRSLIRPLSNIATVIYFRNFSQRYDNAKKADERFAELAKLFQKEELAARKLVERDQKLAALKSNIASQKPWPVFWFSAPAGKGDRQLSVFGENALIVSASRKSGLSVIAPDDTDAFGVQKLSQAQIKELLPRDQATCRAVLAAPSIDELGMEPDECVFRLEYQQAFGGAMSLLHLAQSLYQGASTRLNAP